MSTHKYFDRICIIVVVLSLLFTAAFVNGKKIGIPTSKKMSAYEQQLFDTTKVHKIDIVMNNWDKFIKNAADKKYEACSAVINGESFQNVAIRTKGYNSLENTAEINSPRYSFKLKLDKYEKSENYHGLTKLSLNNISQDSTYMKDYLTYRMMDSYGVKAPLCSYVHITVNGKDWGLYLAIEDVGDSFLKRNYSDDGGKLYKPDSVGDDDMEEDEDQFTEEQFAEGQYADEEMQVDDTSLKYIDNNPKSYAGIFENAKTKITAADKKRLIQSIKRLSENSNIEKTVDIDAVLRYFVVHNFVVNGDSYNGNSSHNFYLYEKNGIMSMIPWDYNLAFGSFDALDSASTVNDPIDNPLGITTINDRPMLAWMLANTEYKELYHQYFKVFLENTDITKIIDDTSTLIAPYVKKDPTKFCTYEQFEKGVTAMRTFCQLRTSSIKGQLSGSIPSDSAGQSATPNKRIDTSSLDITDMEILAGNDLKYR